MRRYLKYVKPYLASFILAPCLMLCEVVGEIQLPTLMADIINVGAANNDVRYILSKGAVMLSIALFMIVTGCGSAYFAAKAATGFSADLRRDLFRRVQEFSFGDIDDFSTGSLVTRLTNDVTQLQNLILMGLRMFMRSPGMLVGGAVMAYKLNPGMARMLLFAMPVLALSVGIIIKIAFPRFGIMQKRIDNINAKIRESLTNIRIIKSFVREDYERGRFGDINEELREGALRAFGVMIINIPLITLIMNLTIMGAVWTGGLQVMQGSMKVGELSAMITYITQVLISLMMLAFILLQSSRALASASRIGEVLERQPGLTDTDAGRRDFVISEGSVEFRNVSFAYYKGNRVLNNLTFSIPGGSSVGIVGSTGSGKSSLVQLIPRLYDVEEGSVLVDGVDVREFSLRHLRDSVSMVLQKNLLFTGSVADNLRWGDDKADEERLKEAAADARALDFVEKMEKGFDSDIARGGSNVSGGQKQRLCIARALLKNPKILILDDSTSAVDTATEAGIRKTFETRLKGVTKIIIAQRITSVMDMDMIIVLEKGRIVGMGTHRELMESCETYREICDSQMSADKEVSA